MLNLPPNSSHQLDQHIVHMSCISRPTLFQSDLPNPRLRTKDPAPVHNTKCHAAWDKCRACRLQALRDNTVPGLQRKADSLEADCGHDNQRLEELQAEFALLEHELQVDLCPCCIAYMTVQEKRIMQLKQTRAELVFYVSG